MNDSYRYFHTYNASTSMIIRLNKDNSIAAEVVADYLHQQDIETLTDEEFCYFLGHGSLDTDAEVY